MSYDKLKEYYAIKNVYDEEYNSIKVDLIRNQTLTWKEKRNELLKKNAKCVNCKRNVGTIFTRNTDENLNTTIKASCGDKIAPCPLNIEIEIDFIENIPEHNENSVKEKNQLQDELIIYKNDVVFGYIKPDKKEIDRITKSLEDVDLYFELLNSKLLKEDYERIEKIKNLEITFYDLVKNIKDNIIKFKETGENKYINDVVELYIQAMIPLNTELSETKYKYRAVEIANGTNYLVEKQHSTDDMEYKIDDYIKVKSFVFGVGNGDKRKKSTTKKREKKTDGKTKNKTKKNIVFDEEKEEKE